MQTEPLYLGAQGKPLDTSKTGEMGQLNARIDAAAESLRMAVTSIEMTADRAFGSRPDADMAQPGRPVRDGWFGYSHDALDSLVRVIERAEQVAQRLANL